MRSASVATLICVILASIPALSADVLVFKDGSRNEVLSLHITERGVHFVTLNGKRQSIILDAIDVPATVAANEPPAAASTAASRALPGHVLEAKKEEPPREPATPVAPLPPTREPPAPKRAPAPPPASTTPAVAGLESGPPRHRFAFTINGSMGTAPLDFAESHRYELFVEEARVDNSYRAPSPRGMEIGGFFRIKGPIGMGASVELFRNDNEAAYSAFLPHPFYFERYRELAGVHAGLTHREQALHVDGVVSQTWANRFTLDLFGGPTLFWTKTEVLVDLLYSEIYPYDAVVPLGVATEIFEDRPLGYHFGTSATYRLAGRIGIDIGLRFSKARIRLSPTEERIIEFDAGGLRAGAGLRFLFP